MSEDDKEFCNIKFKVTNENIEILEVSGEEQGKCESIAESLKKDFKR